MKRGKKRAAVQIDVADLLADDGSAVIRSTQDAGDDGWAESGDRYRGGRQDRYGGDRRRSPRYGDRDDDFERPAPSYKGLQSMDWRSDTASSTAPTDNGEGESRAPAFRGLQTNDWRNARDEDSFSRGDRGSWRRGGRGRDFRGRPRRSNPWIEDSNEDRGSWGNEGGGRGRDFRGRPRRSNPWIEGSNEDRGSWGDEGDGFRRDRRGGYGGSRGSWGDDGDGFRQDRRGGYSRGRWSSSRPSGGDRYERDPMPGRADEEELPKKNRPKYVIVIPGKEKKEDAAPSRRKLEASMFETTDEVESPFYALVSGFPDDYDEEAVRSLLDDLYLVEVDVVELGSNGAAVVEFKGDEEEFKEFLEYSGILVDESKPLLEMVSIKYSKEE